MNHENNLEKDVTSFTVASLSRTAVLVSPDTWDVHRNILVVYDCIMNVQLHPGRY